MAVSFNERLKSLISLLTDYRTLKALLSLKHSGYLKEIGWFNAFDSGFPVDRNNNPVPWVTYPFIDFISTRLKNNFTVFEYGSGSSTLFYSKRVKELTAVEHDKEWFNKIKGIMPQNVNLEYNSEDEDGTYCRTIESQNKKFDLIIVDAVDRNNCIKISPGYLSDNGIIILDDSEREQYEEGKNLLSSQNFKCLDFWGISPGYLNRKCTTIFYKSVNCLDI
ncbi:MAG: hypothetical protein WB996_10625 [Ignavibacteriaceae bacterium]